MTTKAFLPKTLWPNKYNHDNCANWHLSQAGIPQHQPLIVVAAPAAGVKKPLLLLLSSPGKPVATAGLAIPGVTTHNHSRILLPASNSQM
jgi:hypothetical protein